MIETSVRISSDQPETGTALVDITGLNFSLSVGTLYTFEFYLLFTVSSTSQFLNAGLTVPAFTTYSAQVITQSLGSDGTISATTGCLTSSGDSVRGQLGGNNMGVGVTYLTVISGSILPSASGTMQAQFARFNSGGTTTIKANTFGILRYGY